MALLDQARLAARNRVSLDTVCCRYLAGQALLTDFLLQEVGGAGNADLRRLLGAQATLFDRLLAAVSAEHARETQSRFGSAEQHQLERVQRLLAGESLDTSTFAYNFGAHHTAVIAQGPGAEEALQRLARELDQLCLLVSCGEAGVWAWLGARRRLCPEDLLGPLHSGWPKQISLAIGEPAPGLAGWRLTHQQARAALPIARSKLGQPVRYAEVALLVSMLHDQLLTTSLRQLYLVPLQAERDGGRIARETLRAYFAADRNVSSAAALLGVRRHTVASRLQSIEERIARPLNSCAAELDTALRLEELEGRLLPRGAITAT